MREEVFVFGSNLAGRHGKGAALHARQHYGAIYGQGSGRQGDSYGIPTKSADLRTMPLSIIAQYVDQFLAYGYQDHQIAPSDSAGPSQTLYNYPPKTRKIWPKFSQI